MTSVYFINSKLYYIILKFKFYLKLNLKCLLFKLSIILLKLFHLSIIQITYLYIFKGST